ncbi:hypothetical protein FKM82_020091, partial [Ascaphus truei]
KEGKHTEVSFVPQIKAVMLLLYVGQRNLTRTFRIWTSKTDISNWKPWAPPPFVPLSFPSHEVTTVDLYQKQHAASPATSFSLHFPCLRKMPGHRCAEHLWGYTLWIQ